MNIMSAGCLLLAMVYAQPGFAVRIRHCNPFWVVTVDSGRSYQITSETLESRWSIQRICFKGKYKKLFGEITYRFVARCSEGDIKFEIEDQNRIITLGHRNKPSYSYPCPY